jgi:hypothetical protein
MAEIKKENRWAELCDLYHQARGKGGDAYFRMGRLAVHLQKATANSCGCDESYVHFYKFTHGLVPLYDQAEKVSNGWSAISETETGWVFALGILLEVSQNTHPKIIVTFPIEVVVKESSFDLKSTMFPGTLEVRATDEHYRDDLQAVGEKVYEGLRRALLPDEARTGSAIGFHAYSE